MEIRETPFITDEAAMFLLGKIAERGYVRLGCVESAQAFATWLAPHAARQGMGVIVECKRDGMYYVTMSSVVAMLTEALFGLMPWPAKQKPEENS